MLVVDMFVGADMKLDIWILPYRLSEPGRQLIHCNRFTVPVKTGVVTQGEFHVIRLSDVWAARCLRQVDFNGMREQRRRNDKNHQQYQHHVHQWYDVDFSHRKLPVTAVHAAECHYSLLSPGAAAGETNGVTTRKERSSPGDPPVFVPTVIRTKRSWAKASSRASQMRL